MVLVTVLYLGLSFSHPDYWIAKYNISCIKKQLEEAFSCIFGIGIIIRKFHMAEK